MSTTVILIRHAQSEGNTNRESYKTTPDQLIGLTEKGVEQARIASAHLNKWLDGTRANIFASPYKRARDTMRIALAGCQGWIPKNQYEDIRLRERAFNFETRFPKHFFDKDCGESLAELSDRAQSFKRDLEERMAIDSNISHFVIFTHSQVMRVLHLLFTNSHYENYELENRPGNCCAYAYSVSSDFAYEIINGPKNPRNLLEVIN